jgi:hypothetical protein
MEYRILASEIFEVSLLKNYGFAYCYLIELEIKNFDFVKNDRLAYTYDFYSTSPTTVPIEEIVDQGYIFEPKLLLGDLPRRGANKWKKLGDVLINDNFKIPDMKLCYQLGDLESAKFENLDWYLVRNLTPFKSELLDYNLVERLPFFAHFNHKLLNAHITMEWMLRRGDLISSYFDDKDFELINNLSFVYSIMKSSVVGK